MSAAESAPPPSGGDDEAQRAEEEFLESLPPHLRQVGARQELTRADLPRRGGSLDDPQLSEATQRVWDAEKELARCQAAKHRTLAALYEHDGEYEEITELDSVDTTRAALALRVTGSSAGWQLRDAYQAVHLFPRCLEAMESGAFPAAWFQKMLKTSRSLTDRSRKELDLAVSTWSPDITPERFFTLLKKLIALLEQREERPDPLARLTRSVELLPSVEPGMGTLQVSGPIPDILAQWKQLDESARAVQAAQRAALREGTPISHDPDGRVLETGRALPLTELRFALMTSASMDLDGVQVPASRFRLNVVIPALTLLGASDEPGTLDGTIPLPPSMARSLAGGCETWYRVLAGPSQGAFLPLPADKYVATTAMLEHLRLRNSTCAVPGCTRPTSWASECDHIEECRRGTSGEGGLTEIGNLHLLCWQHHLDKTNGLLDPTRLRTEPTAPGRTRWSVGRDGDVVTVIDDLDTASPRIAEELAAAWSCFLRGTHAADPVTEPVEADPDEAVPDGAGPEPPGLRGTGRVIPLDRRDGPGHDPARPSSTDRGGVPRRAPFHWEPPLQRNRHEAQGPRTSGPGPSGTDPSETGPSGHRPSGPGPSGHRPSGPDSSGPPGPGADRPHRDRPPGGTGIPPGPWGEHGPPPF